MGKFFELKDRSSPSNKIMLYSCVKDVYMLLKGSPAKIQQFSCHRFYCQLAGSLIYNSAHIEGLQQRSTPIIGPTNQTVLFFTSLFSKSDVSIFLTPMNSYKLHVQCSVSYGRATKKAKQ